MMLSPQLSFQTLVQIIQQLVLVFSDSTLNTLTAFHLLLSFPKLRMEWKCTLSVVCQYVSRPGTRNTMMTCTCYRHTDVLEDVQRTWDLTRLSSQSKNCQHYCQFCTQYNVTPPVASLSFNKHLAVQIPPTVFDDNINNMCGR